LLVRADARQHRGSTGARGPGDRHRPPGRQAHRFEGPARDRDPTGGRATGAADHRDPAPAARLPRLRPPGLRRGPAEESREVGDGGVATDRLFFGLGSLSAFIAVALGAFGAHGLRGRLTPDLLATFETGVRYHMFHALGLLAVAWAATRWPGGGVAT